jgi:ribonuclease HII
MKRETSASLSFMSATEPAGDPFFYERSLATAGIHPIAGVDEAGRGPLAGPVVAGCVVLTPDCDYLQFKDSKKLSPSRRETLFTVLQDSDAAIGTGVVTAEEIDSINILQASLLAMKRAVDDCRAASGCRPAFLLVDGTFTVPMDLPQQALIKGEYRSASIAAASIIAKVSRDRMMVRYHERYPQYNFLQHKGYPTKAHRAAVADFGPCPIHRKTFEGVREFCPEMNRKRQNKQSRLW